MREVDTPAENLRFPKVELEIVRGRAKNKIRRIDVPVFLIGAAHDCDLVLADTAFPEVHTYLYVTKSGVSVRRLGVGPDMVVDGEVVQSAAIHNGQRLRLGDYEFSVRVQEPAPRLSGRSNWREDSSEFATLDSTHHHFAAQHQEPLGVADVKALLADIRASLKIETGLKLYVESESPWRTVTSNAGVSVRKATA